MLIMVHVRSELGEFWGKIVSVTNRKELDLSPVNVDFCNFRNQFVNNLTNNLPYFEGFPKQQQRIDQFWSSDLHSFII